MRERLGSLVFGDGSTMEQIALASRRGELQMDIACVLAGKEGIGAIDRARKLNLPVEIVDQKWFRGDDGKVDQYGFGQALVKVLRKHGITVVMQNGWLPHTPKNVIDEFPNMIFNQHPGPLPETRGMYGVQPHATMLYFTKMTERNNGTEVVVQRVHVNFDEGAIVGRAEVPIYFPYDTPKRLQKRALRVEHRLQIEVLKQIIDGTIKETPQEYHYMEPGEEYILKSARQRSRSKYQHG